MARTLGVRLLAKSSNPVILSAGAELDSFPFGIDIGVGGMGMEAEEVVVGVPSLVRMSAQLPPILADEETATASSGDGVGITILRKGSVIIIVLLYTHAQNYSVTHFLLRTENIVEKKTRFAKKIAKL